MSALEKIKAISFYDKDLSIIQRNAKKLQAHPVMSNVPGIQDQLSFLKSSHRRFIFAALKEIFGEDKARIIIQHEKIKNAINHFDNLSPKVLSDLKDEHKSNFGKNLLLKIKHSFYYKNKSPKVVKKELLDNTKDKLPDLRKLPKFKKAV